MAHKKKKSSTPNKTKPVLQSILFCDAVAKDANGKPVLVGVFDQVKRPGPIPQFSLFIKFIGGTGKHYCTIRILDPDLAEIYKQPNVIVDLTHKAVPASVISQFTNFVFQVPGVYWFEVLLNGGIVISIPLPVNQPAPT